MTAGPSVAIVTTTVADETTADRLAGQLVDEELAACVQILPIRSVYRWQGSIERAAEVMLVIKTTEAAADRLVARIEELHSYDTPEIVVTPVIGGSPAYLEWVTKTVVADHLH